MCLCLLGFIFPKLLFSQNKSDDRIQWSINDNWKFLPHGADFGQTSKIDDSKWELVNIPHTWNAADPFDDDQTSRKGISWYRKKIYLDNRFKDKKVYLYFEGANQVADVYVNGVFAGQHKGGYTAFNFDITDLVNFGDKATENLIAVQLNNAQDNFIPPLSIGYASYGGIYRDAWLIATNKLHFKTKDHASSGIFISTPSVSSEKALVKVKSTIVNETAAEKKLIVVNTIYDSQNKKVSEFKRSISIAADKEQTIELLSEEIKSPNLWSPENPYLYQLTSRIIENGEVIDEVTNPLGFRWFNFDPNNGFSLNGKKLVLKGTNRHQDFQGKGDALTDEDHLRDMKIIKNMGCNFIRLAHYPQDPEVMRLADEMGFIIWVEIPLVNFMNPVPEFLENSKHMIREMIRQSYNHPSVMIWGSMNEVLLWSEKAVRIQTHTNQVYLDKVRNYAIQLDSTVRAEDPTRRSTMAMHMSDQYDNFRFSNIPQIAAYNIYNGWYSGKVEEFGPVFDRLHKKHPEQVFFVSEYGCESDQQVNTENPIRKDFTGQYQRYYHEAYLEQIKQRPYLAGTAIWNEFDFSQPNVGGTISSLNHKGMVTWDRKPKDVFYMYKANWNPEPMVYIATRDWLIRAGKPDSKSTFDVYANMDEVTLQVNGKTYSVQKPNAINKFSWKVELKQGDNIVIANGKKNGKSFTDRVVVQYQIVEDNLVSSTTPFKSLSVNVGSNTQYIDDSEHIWIEDQPYKKGSYGFIAGTSTNMDIKAMIKNTQDTPQIYSYQDDIKGYRADVPDGNYEVELSFAEPAKETVVGDRVFDVAINGNVLLKNMDLYAEYGFGVTTKKKYIIKALNGEGINVTFNATKGKAVLNGIMIKVKSNNTNYKEATNQALIN